MRNYYFLTNLCPPLKFGEQPEISFSDLKAFFYINLSEEDQHIARSLQFYIDLYNLRALWLEKPIDERGYYSKNELEERMATFVGFPEYVLDFLQKYDTSERRMRAFPGLISTYFKEEIAHTRSPFVKEYLTFEREWRLVLLTLRSKWQKKDLLRELQYEDRYDPFVVFMIAQKEGKEFQPPDGYEEVNEIFSRFKEDPLELHKKLLEFRYNRIEEFKGSNPFGIDALLGYMIQLTLVEGFLEIYSESMHTNGIKIVDHLIDTMKEAR